jgi:predicted TIM-barrel fold metal-dependent hydrolase
MDPIIDTNVYLSRWPFRRVAGDETAALVAKLKSQGVVQAWAGSFDGVFHRDLAGVNERLVEECKQHGNGFLLPFGSVNPALPDWEEDLRRCHEEHHMRGIRLHPNYHGYKLDDPAFPKLLTLASERGLVVQLALSMEDERTQHPLMPVPHVDTKPLVEIVKKLPKLRLEIINAFRAMRVEQVDQLTAAGQVYFDIAMLENVAGVAKLANQIPSDRIVFGSYFPFFYFESALGKLRESGLGGMAVEAIREGNAVRLLT